MMTRKKVLKEGVYYRRKSSFKLYKYLGENAKDGKNFLATHIVDSWGQIAPMDIEYSVNLSTALLYTDEFTQKLTYMTSHRKKREDKIKYLLGD